MIEADGIVRRPRQRRTRKHYAEERSDDLVVHNRPAAANLIDDAGVSKRPESRAVVDLVIGNRPLRAPAAEYRNALRLHGIVLDHHIIDRERVDGGVHIRKVEMLDHSTAGIGCTP